MATWRKVVVSGSDAHLSTLEIGTAGAVAGTLINRSTVAGSLITGSYSGSYQGGTIDNTTIGGTTAAAGTFTSIVGTSLDLNGDMDLTTQATDIDLVDNNASALSFDAAGQAGILEIDTQDGSEKVKMAKGLDVAGALDVDGATTLDQVTIATGDGAFQVAGAGIIDLDSNVDIDNATTAIDSTTSTTVTSPNISFVGAITGSTHLSSSAQSTASFGQLDLVGNLTAASGTFSQLTVNGNITASIIHADAFTSVDGGNTIDFNDSVDMEDGLTVHGNTALGDAISDTVTITGHITASGDISGSHDSALSGGTLFLKSNADIDGDLDVDGTTNLDAVDIDGATQIDGTVTVGVDNTGYDVKFFGATTGKSFLYDESADKVTIVGNDGANALEVTDGNVAITDGLDVDGATSLDATTISETLDVDGATTLDQTTITVTDGDFVVDGTTNKMQVTAAGGVDIDVNLDVDNTTTDINSDTINLDGANNINITGGVTASAGIIGTTLKVGRDVNDEHFDFATDSVILGKIANTEKLRIDAAGIDVTGNITATGNATVTGDLTVQGTMTTLATTNTSIKDQFIFLGSGSAAVAPYDVGLVVQSGSAVGTGSALYFDGQDNRWSIGTIASASQNAVQTTSHVGTVNLSTSAPTTTSRGFGVGSMWVDTDDEIVYIRTA
tara:strand:+ start:222 stop:2234 length:2013 start_codon:yes stop_codon:yes gene_type:complete